MPPIVFDYQNEQRRPLSGLFRIVTATNAGIAIFWLLLSLVMRWNYPYGMHRPTTQEPFDSLWAYGAEAFFFTCVISTILSLICVAKHGLFERPPLRIAVANAALAVAPLMTFLATCWFLCGIPFE